MKVVGVGCGPGMLTLDAIKEIAGAKKIYGSRRAIDIANKHIAEGCEVIEIEDYAKLREEKSDAVALSTGDPLLAGLSYLGGDIVPGISSMQVAFARLRLPLSGSSIVIAHGTGHEAAIDETVAELKRCKIVFIVAEPGFEVRKLASGLTENEMNVNIAVCQDLGYESEKISVGTTLLPPVADSRLFCLVVGKWRGGIT